jgi:hypothetical protein
MVQKHVLTGIQNECAGIRDWVKAAAHPRCLPISQAAIAAEIPLGGESGEDLFKA